MEAVFQSPIAPSQGTYRTGQHSPTATPEILKFFSLAMSAIAN